MLERAVYRKSQAPVIVLGNQKSGTSAIAHLLADRCGLSKTVDVPALWSPALEELLRGRLALADVVRRNPRPFSVQLLKEPNLTFLVEQVREVFPAARYVFVIRDPRDNLRSLLDRMGLPGDLERLDPAEWKLPASWRPIFDPALWKTEREHYVEQLADRWNRAADAYLRDPDEIRLVRYEDFRADKLGTIDRLALDLGLSPRRDVSAQADVQYQPRGSGATPLSFFGARNLGAIERICGGRMASFGYAALAPEGDDRRR
jgi:hypothetical protein